MSSSRLKDIFGLGPSITQDDLNITGSRLPTSKQVLRCFLSHQNYHAEKNLTKRDCAKKVLEKVLPFYNKANIPDFN